MTVRWLKRNGFILLALTAWMASVAWTGISIQPESAVVPVQDLSLVVTSDYRITSGKGLIIWPNGTVFEQGKAAYFYAAQPQVTVKPSVKIEGQSQGQVTGTLQSRAELQAVNDKGQIYWSYPIKVLQREAFVFSQGGVAGSEYTNFTASGLSLDVAGVYGLALEISKELNFQTGVLQLVVTTDIHVTGTAGGSPVDKNVTQTLPLILQPESFSIPKPQDTAIKVILTEAPVPPGLMETLLGTARSHWLQLSLDGALTVLILLLFLRRKWSVSKSMLEHRRFKDWITEGTVEVKDKLAISILTLEGLVDLAIDLDKRVIYDPKIMKYFVLAEGMLYVHDSESAKAVLGNRQQLGKLLLERRLIRPEQLETGLYYHQRIGNRLGESLIALGFIDETTLYSTLAAQQHISYYELSSSEEVQDTGWVSTMSLNKARALQAFPLGQRADGKWVIACSEPAKEGIRKVMEELFGVDAITVATRPSAIYEHLERLEAQEKIRAYRDQGNSNEPVEGLTASECEQFTESYYRGNIMHGLLLKAAKLVDPAVLSQAPAQERLTAWLASRNSIDGEIANLLKGLDKAVADMDWKTRQSRTIPGMVELLQKSDYLTPEMVEWAEQERVLQKMPAAQLFIRNYLASAETLQKGARILGALEGILNKGPHDPA